MRIDVTNVWQSLAEPLTKAIVATLMQVAHRPTPKEARLPAVSGAATKHLWEALYWAQSDTAGWKPRFPRDLHSRSLYLSQSLYSRGVLAAVQAGQLDDIVRTLAEHRGVDPTLIAQRVRTWPDPVMQSRAQYGAPDPQVGALACAVSGAQPVCVPEEHVPWLTVLELMSAQDATAPWPHVVGTLSGTVGWPLDGYSPEHAIHQAVHELAGRIYHSALAQAWGITCEADLLPPFISAGFRWTTLAGLGRAEHAIGMGRTLREELDACHLLIYATAVEMGETPEQLRWIARVGARLLFCEREPSHVAYPDIVQYAKVLLAWEGWQHLGTDSWYNTLFDPKVEIPHRVMRPLLEQMVRLWNRTPIDSEILRHAWIRAVTVQVRDCLLAKMPETDVIRLTKAILLVPQTTDGTLFAEAVQIMHDALWQIHLAYASEPGRITELTVARVEGMMTREWTLAQQMWGTVERQRAYRAGRHERIHKAYAGETVSEIYRQAGLDAVRG